MSNQLASPDKGSKAGAGAAGAGGGTLLMAVASSLQEGSRLKPLLMWAAPSVSVFLSGLWLWIQFKVTNYLRDREVQSLIDEAQRTLEGALNNQKTSDGHKAKIRRQLERLEQLRVDRQMERIKSVTIVTEDEIQDR